MEYWNLMMCPAAAPMTRSCRPKKMRLSPSSSNALFGVGQAVLVKGLVIVTPLIFWPFVMSSE